MSKVAKSALATAAITTLVATTASQPAHADPSPDQFRNFAAVGSDTIQDVWNGLTNNGNVNGGPIAGIASFNAFGSATIQTKAAGATFTRPAGSGNGVKALSAVWDPTGDHTFNGVVLNHDEVDFARSSSGPSAGTGLSYIPFARDAVSVALKPFASGSPQNFTTAQLAAIYGGSDNNTSGTNITYDATTGLPKLGTKTLVPLLPQAGSGTRKFFQSAIGITDADLASYVDPNSTTAENDGTQLTAAGQLIPFSAAQWIAQRNGASADTTTGDSILKLNSLAAVSGSGTALAPGALFGTKNPQGNFSTPPVAGVGVFNRDTYSVVPTSFTQTGATQLQRALVLKLTGTSTGQLGSAGARSVIKKYGFGLLTYYANQSDWKVGGFQH